MKVVVVNHVTLDGVTQAPGRPDEDRRGGFEHGGWSVPFGDAVLAAEMGRSMSQSGALLLGRRTYEDFFSFWPKQTDSPFTAVLDNVRKYVASTTLREPLAWKSSTLLEGDAAEAVAKLKDQPGKDLVVLGSAVLVQSLMRRGLVDEYLLTVHPLVLGTGRRLFADGGAPSVLQLVDAKPTTRGVIVARYRRVQGAVRDARAVALD
ncbi:MAG TPA: dihydrofolate reductase family protein [Polyangiaceae bacterium]|nr:dihydrofolate reductase family protein [Polyangiaceae bacterium]